MNLKDLLERGYFPKELPDSFTTASLAYAVAQGGVALPAAFGHAAFDPRPPVALPARYSLARGGLSRRALSIPNPVLYYLLCNELVSGWATIAPSVAGTSLSATHPAFPSSGRAIDGSVPLRDKPMVSLKKRLNKRYVLQTDISRFYHSIYTHSIAWALHSKPTAKGNRGPTLIGNRIDFWSRNSQDGQTVGIPIGPDTSLLIAEILMQACDARLEQEIPGVQGHRYIDDYELAFRHRTDAEAAFHILEKILGEFELALNPRKTRVLELPIPTDPEWVGPLRSFHFRETASGQLSDLGRYFDLAFEFHQSHREEAVLQYAISRLRSVELAESNWEFFQTLLLNCVAPEPAAFPYVLRQIATRVTNGAVPDRDALTEVSNALILDHSGLGHSSEVTWALWACLAFELTVSRSAANAVSACDDPVVAILALHCEAEGRCDALLSKDVWAIHMTRAGLYGESWLLSYEANVHGWLPTQGGGDHVGADPNFSFLKSAGVQFYDPSRGIPTSPGGAPPTPQVPAVVPVPSGMSP